MRMDLIQPFIGSVDAVLAEMMKEPVKLVSWQMEEGGYRPRGFAAVVTFKGQIEGRVVMDMEPQAAANAISHLLGSKSSSSDTIVTETICEIANVVIGNAVTQLNDRGFQFKVSPPEALAEEQSIKTGADSEAAVLCFETSAGRVYLKIAMFYQSHLECDLRPVMVG